MQRKNFIIYKGEEYQLLLFEENAVFNPRDFGISPIWPKSSKFECFSVCEIENYKLKVKSFNFISDGACPSINGIEAVYLESVYGIGCREYRDINMPIQYTGSMVIGREFLGDYGNEKEFPCYCYQSVIELIFDDGDLVTTIDHRKAMIRIRKNIDKGLRDINIRKDKRCIKRFMKDALVGEYFESGIKKYLKKAVNKLNPINKLKEFR